MLRHRHDLCQVMAAPAFFPSCFVPLDTAMHSVHCNRSVYHTGIVYVPLSLHWVGHLFPSSSSPRLKTYFIIVSFLSLISFGALPFFWMLACLIWRQCGKKDKWITGICCIALVLFPLSVRFEACCALVFHRRGRFHVQ